MSNNRTPSKEALRLRVSSEAIRSAVMVSRQELAGLLGCSIPTIDRRLAEGELDSLVVRIGSTVRFRNPLTFAASVDGLSLKAR